ncbi:Rab geranylgeranyltransferase [Microbotryomycetes sp. JL201]|nr:Rab geranylgeranyltransferase [Microbotryomycetes sp. JL201]
MALPTELLTDLHVRYIQQLDERRDLSYHMTQHLRMNGVYWGLTALALLNKTDALPRQDMLDWVMSCFDPQAGGFAPHPGHDPNLHSTLSAIQILAIQDAMDLLDKNKIVTFWTSVGSLAILNRLDVVDADTLAWWLCERQLPNGGLNGRPEKLEDVCYSWWALATLAILGKSHWIDGNKLSNFILSAQDPDRGGIADRPEDMADVWHTVFGLAGLSLLSHPGTLPVDPVYCMPASVTERVLKR